MSDKRLISEKARVLLSAAPVNSAAVVVAVARGVEELVNGGDKLAETGADVEDKAEACEDDEGGVVVGFTVDGGAGTGIVWVDVVVPPGRVDAPPGPAQTCPFGQQPNCPFVPRLQNEPTGQPPVKSGQQVNERGMQPEPQSFSPCAEHGS
jgi:hypothetical protein